MWLLVVCCLLRKEDWEQIGRLKPEDRVNMAVGMSDVCVRVCADGVRVTLLDGSLFLSTEFS